MRKVPYTPPKCTICGKQATVFAENGEPRCVRHQQDGPSTRTCPRCGGLMVIRENKKNHTFFWGCTNFPRCTGTMAI